MAKWAVVVWAAVTRDLLDPFKSDIQEVARAVGAAGSENVALTIAFTPTNADAASVRLPDGIGSLGTVQDGHALGDKLLEPGTHWTDADRRMLVLWGHGALGLRTIDAPYAVPVPTEVVQAFSGTQIAQPDIIGYDACRMASAPTVLALAEGNLTSVFIGSMIPEPASGWPYAELLDTLGRGQDAETTATAVVQAYAAAVDVPDWCLLALRLDNVAQGAGALRARLAELRSAPAPGSIDFFAAASGADTMDDSDLVDLGALMRRLADQMEDPPATRELYVIAAGITEWIRAATVAHRASGNLDGMQGLSVRVGMPSFSDPKAWPARPGWSDFFPDVWAVSAT